MVSRRKRAPGGGNGTCQGQELGLWDTLGGEEVAVRLQGYEGSMLSNSGNSRHSRDLSCAGCYSRATSGNALLRHEEAK